MLLPTASLVTKAGGATDVGNGGLLLADTSMSVNLTLNATPYALPSSFWGTTISARAPEIPGEANLIESTPAKVLIWPGAAAGDDYDPIHNIIYATTSGKANPNPTMNETQFVNLCRSINCTAIVQLPGEIDNASIAADVVQNLVENLSFQPAYWEIGNEPGLWKHWQIPWTSWATHRKVNPPTPMQYADEVSQYIPAIRAVDPTAQIIGLPGVGKASLDYSQWINDTVSVNGPQLSAIAVHEYPESATGNVTLAEFYAAINGPTSISQRVPEIDSWVETACPTCHIPLFLTEIGSGLSHKSYGTFERGFPGAVDIAAQMTEAMNFGVSNVDLYATVLDTNNSWFGLDGSERPVYSVYSTILDRLGSEVYTTNVTSPFQAALNTTTYAVATVDPSSGNRADLLVVNTNVTENATFSPQLPGIPSTSPTELWTWENNSTETPVAAFDPAGYPSTFTLPPQSLVLFESYPSQNPGTPLRFDEVGLNLSTVAEHRWFVDVNGSLSSSAETDLTLFLPPGDYSTGAPSLTINGSARERAEPFAPSSVTVDSAPSECQIPFADQWNLTLVIEPVGAGTITPTLGWVNASVPLDLTANATPGYVLSHWFGWGAGSFNGSANPAQIVPVGPITEKAIFVPAYPVTFAETGLPGGADWSVVVRGTTYSSTTSSNQFQLPNGSYGFRILPPPEYRAHPVAGSFAVAGSSNEVEISFQLETPPGQPYPVTFKEVGLPSGTTWSVTVRGQTNSSSTASIGFTNLTNGTYGFQVGPVPGYRSSPTNSSFTVDGAALEVSIQFIARTPPGQTYTVTFREMGLLSGTNWTVTVRSVPETSSNQTILFSETNGTHGFQVGTVPGYRSIPTNSSFTVQGAPLELSIQFVARTPPATSYEVTFQEFGLPTGTVWTVTVRNSTVSTSSTTLRFNETNGTHGFQVGPVPGYRSSPTNSSFTVDGAALEVSIQFIARTPPGQTYTVRFQEVGLPTGAFWSVTVRNSTITTRGTSLQFNETNGSFGFQVSTPIGYRADYPRAGFDVNGTAVVVNITYVPRQTAWAVHWVETGLYAGVTWWVMLDGAPVYSNGTWTTVVLPNGTYPYEIEDSADFVPHARVGNAHVSGADASIQVDFTRAMYPVAFRTTGLPQDGSWTVRLSSQSIETVSELQTFELPNGTYTFDIEAPAGYYPVPSHGNLTVKAGAVTVTVTFLHNGLPPPKYTAWYLGARALGVAAVAALAGWGSFALLSATRRRRRPGRSP